jgi:hypothetical protein
VSTTVLPLSEATESTAREALEEFLIGSRIVGARPIDAGEIPEQYPLYRVALPLGSGAGDEFDLPLVEAEAFIGGSPDHPVRAGGYRRF